MTKVLGEKMFKLPVLPYKSLEPHVSSKQLDVHYNGHHKAYVDNLNRLVVGTEFADMSNDDLEHIVKSAHGDSSARVIFNNASQAWNHSFYWQSMAPGGGGDLPEDVVSVLDPSVGTVEKLRDAFVGIGVSHFGSGWIWVVYDKEKRSIGVVGTHDADSPLLNPHQHPLLCMDVWEHAYYIDCLNVRKKYVECFFDFLINWNFASQRLASCLAA